MKSWSHCYSEKVCETQTTLVKLKFPEMGLNREWGLKIWRSSLQDFLKILELLRRTWGNVHLFVDCFASGDNWDCLLVLLEDLWNVGIHSGHAGDDYFLEVELGEPFHS